MNLLISINHINTAICKFSYIAVFADKFAIRVLRRIHSFSMDNIITSASLLTVPLCFKAAMASDSLPEWSIMVVVALVALPAL